MISILIMAVVCAAEIVGVRAVVTVVLCSRHFCNDNENEKKSQKYFTNSQACIEELSIVDFGKLGRFYYRSTTDGFRIGSD